jgi:hypothetical protein
VVSCRAFDKSDGATLDPTADGYNLGEPVDGASLPEIEPSTIYVAGKQLYWADPNADHAVMLQIPLDKPNPVVTPSVENVTWYNYHLETPAGVPLQVALTWSKHPLVASPRDLQADFDAGAELLARDDDGQGGGGDYNDVPCYMEFFIIKAKRATFPNSWAGYDFTNSKYNHLKQRSDAETLLDTTFANVKLVQIMEWPTGTYFAGAAADGGPSMILANTHDPSPGPTAIHEYGHTAGLEELFTSGHSNNIMYFRGDMGDGGEECTVNQGSALYGAGQPPLFYQ